MSADGSNRGGLLSTVYVHFSGVIGALSIVSFLSHLVEWRGFIRQAVEWWADVVRPLVDFVFWPVIYLLDKYLLTDIYIPIILKDYLAVGIVFIFSRWRAATVGWEGGTTAAVGKIFKKLVRAIILFARTLFIWPAEMVTVFLNALYPRSRFPGRQDKEEIRQIRLTHALALLPVLYAVFIVIANFFV